MMMNSTAAAAELTATCVKNLTAVDIEAIKKQYNLVHAKECPSKIETPEIIKNTYPEYDWQKVKVGATDGKVRSSYPAFEEELAKQKKEDKAKEAERDWQKMKVRNIDGARQDFAINNYYKNDPSINTILDLAKKEQKDKMAPLAPPPSEKDKPVAPLVPPADSFFNKFMKVVLPQ
jgi:hypothetical protein